MENWVPVQNYEGLYEISDHGRIKCLPKIGNPRERIMKLWKGEYLHIGLTRNNKQTCFRVHRLVASHFLNSAKGLRYVNHKNGNKHDNRAKNLEWCDPRMNLLHAYATALKSNGGVKNPRAKLTEREVRLLRYLKSEFPSITAASVGRFYGMTDVAICDVWNMKRWKSI